MMLLAVNLGNTNASFGIFANGVVVRHGRLALSDIPLLPDLIGQERFERIVLASVVPSRTEQAISMLAMAYGGPVLIAGQDLPYGMEIECDEPAKVGADRILNAIAAYKRTRTASIVADVGTAITVDIVSMRGTFCGGAIAAGPTAMLEALHKRTELLPSVAFQKPASPVGRNTVEAMLAGAYWGTLGLLKELIAQASRVVSERPPVLLTGGGAEPFIEDLKGLAEYHPALTLEGLALIASGTR